MRLRTLSLPAMLVAALLMLAGCSGPTEFSAIAPDASAPYDIKVTTDPPNLQHGQKATFNYQFVNKTNNKPVIDLAPVWDRAVHTVMINREMNWFQHGSTSAATNGWYPVQIWFSEPGQYFLWTQYADEAGNLQAPYKQEVSFGAGAFDEAAEGPAPLNESEARTKLVYGVDVTLETSELRVGAPAKFTYSLAIRGQPVDNLSPYLGAAGHMYAFSADHEEFAHIVAEEVGGGGEPSIPSEGGGTGSDSGGPQATAEPSGTETAAIAPSNFGPTVTFEHEFEKAGLYKTFAQFHYGNNIMTADFVVRINP